MMELVRLLEKGQHRKEKSRAGVHVYETGPAGEAEKKLKERDGREQQRAHLLD